MAQFDKYVQSQDPQLMLQEKFWLQLKLETTETFDLCVMTVKERAAKFKFPANKTTTS